MKLSIKKGQKVKLISGEFKGKTGEVLEIDKKNLKVRVAGISIKSVFNKRTREMTKKESFIDYSNIAAAK